LARTLEICVDTVTAAQAAAAAGADRIELCENLAQGGVTPSAGKISRAKAVLSIPVFVLIRPRPGDFHYRTTEFDLLLADIAWARQLGADGIVAGDMGPQGTLDEARVAALVAAADPLPLTFHRAFDQLRDPYSAIDTLARAGVARILTAGGLGTALEGKDQIASYVALADGAIKILAGGGVRPHSLEPLLQIPGLEEFHSSARGYASSPLTSYARTFLGFGEERIRQELDWATTDPATVQALKEQLLA
jgi:copper homeostasis protein